MTYLFDINKEIPSKQVIEELRTELENSNKEMLRNLTILKVLLYDKKFGDEIKIFKLIDSMNEKKSDKK